MPGDHQVLVGRDDADRACAFLDADDGVVSQVPLAIEANAEVLEPGAVRRLMLTLTHVPQPCLLQQVGLDTGPLVSFARSGIAAHWKASAYQSILELAEACDVPVRRHRFVKPDPDSIFD